MEIEALKRENKKLKETIENLEKKRVDKINRKKRAFSFIGSLIAGKSLKDSIYNSINEFNEQRKVSLNTTSNLVANLIKRLTRIGVVALLIALLPTTVMIYQNNLLKIQNKKIQEQTYLSEASRRSSQMFIMSDVLSDLNNEIVNKGTSMLSAPLIGRIVSLSRAMKPYRYLINDKIIEKPISPERGQLLISLCKSNLSPSFFVDAILQESDFTKSELINASLRNSVLREINLNESNLQNAYFANVDLRRASLINTNLKNIDLEDADLRNANFLNANLNGAYLNDAKLNGANLTGVTLDSVKVNRADWLLYIKDKLKLKGAKELYEDYKIDSVYANANSTRKTLMILKN